MAKTAGNAADKLSPKSRETALRRARGKRVGKAIAKALKKKTGIAKGVIGRPSVYDPQKTPEKAKRYALLGLSNAEIAGALDINEETFYAWKRKYPAFSEMVEEGKLAADAEVANSLYMRARGGLRMPAVKIFLPKDSTEPVYAPYEEVLVPDVGAAKLWLTNRQPQRWRERKEVEVSGGIEHKIASMSQEERLARLLELQAKAAQIIEGEAVEVPGEPEE